MSLRGLYLEGLIHGGAYFRNFKVLSNTAFHVLTMQNSQPRVRHNHSMWILRHTLIKSHLIWIPHILKIQLAAVQSHICTVECNIISDIDIMNSRNGLACRDSRFSSFSARRNVCDSATEIP